MHELLRLAAEVAVSKNDTHRNFLLGAVAVRRDQAIVKSSNGSAYVPYPSAHAEARVCRKAGLGSTIYVARIARKDGCLALARPCNGCWMIMRNHRVRKCYYTISETEYGIITFGDGSFVERIKKINKLIYGANNGNRNG